VLASAIENEVSGFVETTNARTLPDK